MGFRWTAAAWLLVAAVVVTAGLVLASLALVPEPPARMALPTAGELVSLEPYLDPADIALPREAGVPERVPIVGSPFGTVASRDASAAGAAGGSTGEVGPAGEASPRRPRWRLSAVMVAGDRRIAIINDRMVRPGDRLEDGTRIEMVEGDHVVIITPNGQRRRLDLER